MANRPAKQVRSTTTRAAWAKPRREQSASARGYDAAWNALRKVFLSDPRNSVCARCFEQGSRTPTDIVDHIVPHRGDDRLRLDINNLQPLCHHHHASEKQRAERADGHY